MSAPLSATKPPLQRAKPVAIPAATASKSPAPASVDSKITGKRPAPKPSTTTTSETEEHDPIEQSPQKKTKRAASNAAASSSSSSSSSDDKDVKSDESKQLIVVDQRESEAVDVVKARMNDFLLTGSDALTKLATFEIMYRQNMFYLYPIDNLYVRFSSFTNPYSKRKTLRCQVYLKGQSKPIEIRTPAMLLGPYTDAWPFGNVAGFTKSTKKDVEGASYKKIKDGTDDYLANLTFQVTTQPWHYGRKDKRDHLDVIVGMFREWLNQFMRKVYLPAAVQYETVLWAPLYKKYMDERKERGFKIENWNIMYDFYQRVTNRAPLEPEIHEEVLDYLYRKHLRKPFSANDPETGTRTLDNGDSAYIECRTFRTIDDKHLKPSKPGDKAGAKPKPRDPGLFYPDEIIGNKTAKDFNLDEKAFQRFVSMKKYVEKMYNSSQPSLPVKWPCSWASKKDPVTGQLAQLTFLERCLIREKTLMSFTISFVPAPKKAENSEVYGVKLRYEAGIVLSKQTEPIRPSHFNEVVEGADAGFGDDAETAKLFDELETAREKEAKAAADAAATAAAAASGGAAGARLASSSSQQQHGSFN